MKRKSNLKGYTWKTFLLEIIMLLLCCIIVLPFYYLVISIFKLDYRNSRITSVDSYEEFKEKIEDLRTRAPVRVAGKYRYADHGKYRQRNRSCY